MKRTSSQLKQLARESLAHRFSLPVMACVITFGIIMLVNMLPAALFPDTGNSISYLVISFITDLLLSILSVGPSYCSAGGNGCPARIYHSSEAWMKWMPYS